MQVKGLKEMIKKIMQVKEIVKIYLYRRSKYGNKNDK